MNDKLLKLFWEYYHEEWLNLLKKPDKYEAVEFDYWLEHNKLKYEEDTHKETN